MSNPQRRGITVPLHLWDMWQDMADRLGYQSRSELIRTAVDYFLKWGSLTGAFEEEDVDVRSE